MNQLRIFEDLDFLTNPHDQRPMADQVRDAREAELAAGRLSLMMLSTLPRLIVNEQLITGTFRVLRVTWSRSLEERHQLVGAHPMIFKLLTQGDGLPHRHEFWLTPLTVMLLHRRDRLLPIPCTEYMLGGAAVFGSDFRVFEVPKVPNKLEGAA